MSVHLFKQFIIGELCLPQKGSDFEDTDDVITSRSRNVGKTF